MYRYTSMENYFRATAINTLQCFSSVISSIRVSFIARAFPIALRLEILQKSPRYYASHHGYPRSLRKQKERERKKKEQSSWKDAGRREILSGAIDNRYDRGEKAWKEGEREKDDRSFLE